MQRNRGKQKNGKNLFKKIRYTKGTFHAKMGTEKERNSMNLTEGIIKKRWQEYTKSESEVIQLCPTLQPHGL